MSTFEKKIEHLIDEIEAYPNFTDANTLNFFRKNTKTRQQVKKNMSQIKDSMDYLRVSIKYLLFDLEATRRENAYLKKLLDKE